MVVFLEPSHSSLAVTVIELRQGRESVEREEWDRLLRCELLVEDL